MPVRKPWWRKSKSCYYVWHNGVQTRLDPDERKAYTMWHELALAGPSGGPTLSEVADAYLPVMKRKLSAESLRNQGYLLSLLRRRFGRLRVTALTADDFAAWLDSRPDWSGGYRWSIGTFARGMLSWARVEGLVEADPLAGLKLPAASRRGAESVVDPSVHEKILSAAPAYYRDVLSALQQTGCRPGEVCRVTAADFDAPTATWTLKKHKTLAKTDRPRVVYLTPAVVEMSRRLALLRPDGPLFRNRDGLPCNPDSLSRWVHKTCERLGVKAICYGYRHTLATDALAAGVPDAHVAQLLGHQGTAMLHKHYAHLTARPQVMLDALAAVRKSAGGAVD